MTVRTRRRMSRQKLKKTKAMIARSCSRPVVASALMAFRSAKIFAYSVVEDMAAYATGTHCTRRDNFRLSDVAHAHHLVRFSGLSPNSAHCRLRSVLSACRRHATLLLHSRARACAPALGILLPRAKKSIDMARAFLLDVAVSSFRTLHISPQPTAIARPRSRAPQRSDTC